MSKITDNYTISAMAFSAALMLSACSSDDTPETEIPPTEDKVLSVELDEMRHTFKCDDGPYDRDREGLVVEANVRVKPPKGDTGTWEKWQRRLDGENLEKDLIYRPTFFFGYDEINHRGSHRTLVGDFAPYKDKEHVAFLVVGGSDRNESLVNGALKVSMQRAAGFLPAFEEAGIHPDRVCIVSEGKKYAGGGRNSHEDRHVKITAFSLE